MVHKLFAKDDIVWIKKYFLASIKTPRIVEIMEKSTPFTISFLKKRRQVCEIILEKTYRKSIAVCPKTHGALYRR